ncbi:MAG: response regulator transcription factor [Oscillospiraceae bacterium]
MGYKILIVEDEPRLREVLCDYFLDKGDTPFEADNGGQALELAHTHEFDAILLDIMIPELNGFSVCRALRKEKAVPIIFLTALSDEDDKLLGYELGADDYVTKPFTMSVLYAKTVALIKRSRGSVLSSAEQLEAAEITVMLSARKVIAGNREIALTPKEYALLLCLMRNKNIVMSREQLLAKCWGYDYEGDVRAVDTHIKRLREKLGNHAGCIKTVIKAGYVLEG